ncbi:MAG: S8 family serine peptidase [Bacteroidales bacterium]
MYRINLYIIICITSIQFSYAQYAYQNKNSIDVYDAHKLIAKTDGFVKDTPVVAVIDKGVLINHTHIQNSMWINYHEIPDNGIDDDGNGFIDDVYGWNVEQHSPDVSNGGVGNWHGTPVNGIISAIINNPESQSCVQLLNVVKGESVASIIQALQYVYTMRKLFNETNGEKGAYIVAVNCSWGKDSLWESDYPQWCAMYDSLGSVGVLSIHAVSNEYTNVEKVGDMPSLCSSDYLITVTDILPTGIIPAAYGRYSVDVAAPGNYSYTYVNTGGYGYFGGTSAAAAYVTATVALLYNLSIITGQNQAKHNPAETALLCKNAILCGVQKTPELTYKTVSGGVLNVFGAMKYICDYEGKAYMYHDIYELLRIVSVYPMPINGYGFVQIESGSDVKAILSLVDDAGVTIQQTNICIQKGIDIFSIDFSKIQTGTYTLRVHTSHISRSVMIIIE